MELIPSHAVVLQYSRKIKKNTSVKHNSAEGLAPNHATCFDSQRIIMRQFVQILYKTHQFYKFSALYFNGSLK
jgi:hypothetical protein